MWCWSTAVDGAGRRLSRRRLKNSFTSKNFKEFPIYNDYSIYIYDPGPRPRGPPPRMGWVHPEGGGWKGKKQNMHNVISIHPSIHAYIHTHIHIIHTYVHAHIQTYKYTNIHTYKHTPTHRGRAHTYHTYVHACMLAHLHTDTHPPTHRGAGATELVTYNPPPPTGGGGGKSYHMKPGNPCPLGGGEGGLAGLDHI